MMYAIEPHDASIPATEIVAKADMLTTSKTGIIGVCVPVSFGGTTMVVEEGVYNYLLLSGKEVRKIPSSTTVELVKPPKYGKMDQFVNYGTLIWGYIPNNGYLGNDRAEFLVDTGEMVLRVIYFFKVTNLDTQSESSEAEVLCPKQPRWIISDFLVEDYNPPPPGTEPRRLLPC